jgi:nitrogenase subunit NifH
LEENRNPVQDAREMIGEFCREVTVLVLVFVPLEKIVNKSGFGVWWAVGTITVSAVFLSVGIILEWSKL